MEVSGNNGRKLKEVFPRGKKEFEQELKLHAFDKWDGMEYLVDDDKMPYKLQDFPDDERTPPDVTTTTTPFEMRSTIKPVEKSTTMRLSEKWPAIGSSKKGPTVQSIVKTHAPPLVAGHTPPPGHMPPPAEKRPSMKPLQEKSTFRNPDPWGIYRPIDNEPHPYRPSWMWTPAEKISTARPYYLPPTKTINEWNPHDHSVYDFDRGFPKYKFVFVTESSPFHTGGGAILKIIFSVVGCLAACLIIASYAQRSKRTRRGRVLAVDAGTVENILSDRRPSEPRGPGPLNNDLPPPYYECTLYDMNKYGGDVPPPYTESEDAKQQDHKQQTDQCNNVKNNIGFDCFNETVAPEMRTELVFDNGRIVERPSLTNNETGVASNDNLEQQSTRHADFNDKVVYTDETGNVKGKINK